MKHSLYKKLYVRRPWKPLHPVPEGWTTLKTFRMTEANKYHCSEALIHYWIHKAKRYPELQFQRINKRVVFVRRSI